MIKDQPMNPECAGVYGQNFDKNEFKTKDNATPRPWKLNEYTGEHKDGYTIFDCGGFLNMDEDKANARLIVKTVNCHDKLVEALKEIGETLKDGRNEDAYYLVKQALKKASE